MSNLIDIRDQIKNLANIVEVISESVQLKRNGTSMQGLCPFHAEKSPSFSVTKRLGVYKCFGCGKSGDVIDFVMNYQNLGYVEALRALASRYQIQMDDENRDYERPIPRKEALSKAWLESMEKKR
jgi:DNA primase